MSRPAPPWGPVRIPSGGGPVDGDLEGPPEPAGLVVFAHGSGSGRHSPRNRRVAADLRSAGLATLLMDLLTPEEEARDAATGEHRFDIPLLARRLVDAIDWAREALPGPRIGLFGASTGAAAALVAAAERPDGVGAVVSRGGRPDLAGDRLPSVGAPTLLIVGEADPQVLDLNRGALGRLRAPAELRTVPGATHLFEEPGALDRVVEMAREWFRERLGGRPA